MFETCCNFSVTKIAWSCRDKNRLCKRAFRSFDLNFVLTRQTWVRVAYRPVLDYLLACFLPSTFARIINVLPEKFQPNFEPWTWGGSPSRLPGPYAYVREHSLDTCMPWLMMYQLFLLCLCTTFFSLSKRLTFLFFSAWKRNAPYEIGYPLLYSILIVLPLIPFLCFLISSKQTQQVSTKKIRQIQNE